MRARVWFVVALLVLGAAPMMAQQQPSLAEVARREADRRKERRQPAKVYTNADVKEVAPVRPVVPAKAEAGEAKVIGPGGPTPEQEAEAARATEPDQPEKDEAYWRRRMADARDGLNRSRIFAEALQSRINALTTDFVNRDDPYQREQIARQREEALAELDRVSREIEARSKEIGDLEEEARREGVPPGWLR